MHVDTTCEQDSIAVLDLVPVLIFCGELDDLYIRIITLDPFGIILVAGF